MKDKKPTYPVGVSVLITKDQSVLLGIRRNNTAAGLYSTPGGRIEPKENMFECAVRETREETGLRLKETDLMVIGFEEHFRYGKHYFMFYLHAKKFKGELQNREPEKCEGWKWKAINGINFKTCTEPAHILGRLLTKTLERY